MIAEYDVFVRLNASRDAPFDDPDRPRRAIHVDLHADSRRTGTNVIRKTKRALP